MDKVAYKPSSDPIQEKLRQNKSQWNKEVSLFINDLINFKKTMNGWPSKFHMERSSIKEPIPADPATIIGALAGDFQELAQKGNDLISKQLEYSKARKQKQPKVPNSGAPNTSTTAPNLSQQLSLPMTASSKYELLVEGSNPLSRFVSTLKGPWFGSTPEARMKKYRVAMLKASSDLEKEFKKFEIQIMGSSPESIFSAGKILIKIENQLYYLQDSLISHKTQFSNVLVKKEDSTKEDVDTVKPSLEKELVQQSPIINVEDPILITIKSALTDFRKSQPNFTNLNPVLERALAGLMLKFYNAPSNEDKIKLSVPIMKAYQELLSDTNMRYGTSAPTLSEILISKKASDQLEVVAQNFLHKWLGQVKHQLSPFDKTSALRLDLLKISKDSRNILDKIMNYLEKDIDAKMLNEYLDLIDKNIVTMKQMMKPLENTIRGNMFDKTFLNLLKNKDITEHSFGLDQKQKIQLEKMIQNKQFRELTNMYAGK